MKNIIKLLLQENRFTVFHISAISFFVFGFFIALTATELGPFAALLVPTGIYLVLFSILLELVFWGKKFLRKAMGSWLST